MDHITFDLEIITFLQYPIFDSINIYPYIYSGR